MPRKKATEDVAQGPMTSPGHAARERKYQVEDALRTLTRAEEIRRDGPLMRDVKREAKNIAKLVTKPKGR